MSFIWCPCVILSVGSLAGLRHCHLFPSDSQHSREALSSPLGLGDRASLFRNEVRMRL